MTRLRIVLAISLLGVLAGIPVASAATGAVTQKPSGCDYFLVETSRGLALLEWYGGHDPDVGDLIVGAFESYGMKRVYDKTAGAELRVWVEDYLLSEDSALEKLYEQCD